MPRFIAFLRAINVGGRHVKMAALRGHVAALGYGRVESFIASGNLLLDAPDGERATHERHIEEGLRAALGFEVATFLRTPAEVAALAAHAPFPGADPRDTPYVALFRHPPDESAAARVAALSSAVDALALRGTALYWLPRATVGESRLDGARLERALGQPATVRNLNTLVRLAARAGGEDG